MSWQATAWAAKQKCGGVAGKCLLYALANYADPAGRCWAGQNRLMADTELSERSLRGWLQAFRAAGLLDIQVRRRQDGTRRHDLIVLKMGDLIDRQYEAEDADSAVAESQDQPATGAGCTTGKSCTTNRQLVPDQPATGAGYIEEHPIEEHPIEEPKRETRAREGEKRVPVAAFLKLWPTAATDSRSAINAKWDALPDDERQSALDGIEPFLAEMKKHKRTHVPSGATYLGERKWRNVKIAAQSAAEYKNRVFVREGTPGWSAWMAHRQGGYPSHRCVVDGKTYTGWWFPSLFPPSTAPTTGPPSQSTAEELQAKLEAEADQAAQDFLEAEGLEK